MKTEIRQWLDEILATRPQSVAIPDQRITGRALNKLVDELGRAGYERFWGHHDSNPYVFELPHPAHQISTKWEFWLYPFSIFDRRVQWNTFEGGFEHIGPWLPDYSTLRLRAPLDDPLGKSYSRPDNPRDASPQQIEARYRDRYFEDVEENPIFGEYALTATDDSDSHGPTWCLIEASSAEVIRGAHPELKRELDGGVAISLRPMKGYWVLHRPSADEANKLIRKFGLTNLRDNPSALDDLRPEDRWAFELCGTWLDAHPESGRFVSPLDYEELYSRNVLGRTMSDERITQLVADGPPTRHRNNDEDSAAEPSSNASVKKASAKKASAKKASAKKTVENRSPAANNRAQMEEVGADSPEVEKDWILQLERLGSLFERGLLSEDEFETQKQRLLRQTDKPD